MSKSEITVQEAWNIVAAELLKQDQNYCFFVDRYGHQGSTPDHNNLHIYNIHGFEMKSNLKDDLNGK